MGINRNWNGIEIIPTTLQSYIRQLFHYHGEDQTRAPESIGCIRILKQTPSWIIMLQHSPDSKAAWDL